MKTVEKIVIARQIPDGANMAQRTFRMCQYDTKDINAQVVLVISAILVFPDLSMVFPD